ncbi:hypothetical protein BN1723_016766 [Verticillium longisporum]|uniref:Uncharacterized protein n=1 Tax=Verticillium longisporum TaxID=100787 RepID=A0A0G4LX72_VERLO|nr:hypothetical protein BN1708_014622 [Verticillium longisporum]CRK47524.1 hypothetical protein BN1723_016766 [Verticillium longisporum]
MDTNADIRKVKQLRSSLTLALHLTEPQRTMLDKALKLVQETEDERRQHCPATRSRRKAAVALLSTIYKRLGIEVVFLCSIALSITRLSEVKKNDAFITTLLDSGLNVQHPQNICDLARQYFSPLEGILSEQVIPEEHAKQRKRRPSFDTSPSKRIRAQSFEPVKPSYHGIQDIVSIQEERAGETSNDSADSDSTDGGDEWAEISEGMQDTDAMGTDAGSTGIDVQLYANVYKLKILDVIRVLLNQKDAVNRLTMPHHPSSTPFITIRCPRTLAMQFLSKREQVKW